MPPDRADVLAVLPPPVSRPLCLVGMSNIGKSRWASRLRDVLAADVIDTDQRLAGRLLAGDPAGSGLRGLADWLGQPGAPRYEANSRQLLAAEHDVMREVLVELASRTRSRPCVIDTGGSVIHAGTDVLSGLRAQTWVIHLQATPTQRDQLFARYLEEPKPLIWGDAWQPRPGEPVEDARRRCYPALLAAREQACAKLAHVIVPADLLDTEDGMVVLMDRLAACQPR